MKMYFNQDTGQMERFAVSNFTSIKFGGDDISALLSLTDLFPDTRYQFTIVAYTDVGPGPEAMISVSTRPDGNHI